MAPDAGSLSFIPALREGPHLSFGPNLLLSDNLTELERDHATQGLLEVIETLAESQDLALHYSRAPAAELETANRLVSRGYHQTREFPTSYLDIEWTSFEVYLTYLKSFSHHMSRNVKEEIRLCRDSGIRIQRILQPSDNAERLHELANLHYARLSGSRFPYSSRLLPRLSEFLGDNAVFFGALRDDELLGFVAMLVRGTTAYLMWVGIDTVAVGREATYFNLVYYRPIEEAILRGLERFHFGRTLYSAKARRGCLIREQRYYYQGTTPLRHLTMRPWFVFHSAWMKRRLKGLGDIDRLRSLRPD